ncbi:MAG: pyruvate kinase alpha/beta domain-containing protein [Dehalococcoidales bacterium]|nr:pyruvate kinase alpha/beta domain-containing protein [Dehalococcoidales bacterium]
MEARTVYFKNPGIANTDEVLRLAQQRAKELGIKTIVVASTSGDTAVKAVKALKGMRVVVVGHSAGLKEPNRQEFTEENRKIVESQRGKIVTAAHAFGGLNRSMRQSSIPEASATYIIGDIIADTLRIFGQGTKVACEVATMAADAGLVRTDEDIIAIGGTVSSTAGRGADTAIVIRPSYAHLFFETQIKEVICKPHF